MDRAFEVHESAPEAKLQASIDSLKQQIKMTRSHAEQLKAELTELERKSKDMAVTQLKYETLLNERLNSNKLFDAVVGRLKEVTIVKTDNHGFRATQIAPPTEGEHVYPKTIVVLAVSLMAGVVFGLSLGTLKELSQTRLATVEDVRALARGMGVWRVNRLDLKELKPTSPDTRIDGTLVAFHYPNSPHAECFRGIRTSLYFHARTKEQQVLHITSSRPGEGKTTISGNLAVSLAQTGKKVLLVDADLRRSRVHHLFGIQDGLGITDMIENGAGFAECCHTTEQDGLLILPRGSRIERPSELLMSPRFQNVLKEARSQFDFIIVDSPPLLAVSDASHVSGYVDAMILVVSLNSLARTWEG